MLFKIFYIPLFMSQKRFSKTVWGKIFTLSHVISASLILPLELSYHNVLSGGVLLWSWFYMQSSTPSSQLECLSGRDFMPKLYHWRGQIWLFMSIQICRQCLSGWKWGFLRIEGTEGTPKIDLIIGKVNLLYLLTHSLIMMLENRFRHQ